MGLAFYIMLRTSAASGLFVGLTGFELGTLKLRTLPKSMASQTQAEMRPRERS